MKFIDYLNEMPKGVYKRKKKFPKDGFKRFILEMEKSTHFKSTDRRTHFLYYMNFKYKNIVFPMEIYVYIKDINEIGTLIFKLYADILKPHRIPIVGQYSYNGWFQIHLNQDEWSSEEYVERLLDEIEGDFQKDIERSFKISISHWSIGHTEKEVLNFLITGKYED